MFEFLDVLAFSVLNDQFGFDKKVIAFDQINIDYFVFH